MSSLTTDCPLIVSYEPNGAVKKSTSSVCRLRRDHASDRISSLSHELSIVRYDDKEASTLREAHGVVRRVGREQLAHHRAHEVLLPRDPAEVVLLAAGDVVPRPDVLQGAVTLEGLPALLPGDSLARVVEGLRDVDTDATEGRRQVAEADPVDDRDVVDVQAGEVLDGLVRELGAAVGEGGVDLAVPVVGRVAVDRHPGVAGDRDELHGLPVGRDVQHHDRVGQVLARRPLAVLEVLGDRLADLAVVGAEQQDVERVLLLVVVLLLRACRCRSRPGGWRRAACRPTSSSRFRSRRRVPARARRRSAPCAGAAATSTCSAGLTEASSGHRLEPPAALCAAVPSGSSLMAPASSQGLVSVPSSVRGQAIRETGVALGKRARLAGWDGIGDAVGARPS